jgi:glycerophosphoryl diester phosphodiesterase
MKPLIIAHRGNSDERPENTLASFQSALEVGATMIELDVQLTRDDHIVVIHDPSVDRTTDGSGAVRELTLAEVRQLSAGYPERFGDAYAGERIPTLAEALAFLKGRGRIMLELKTESISDDADAGLEARTLAEVRRAGMTDAVALISFDRRALVRCREQAPEIARGHLFYEAEIDAIVAGARDAGCEIVMPHKHILSEELASRLRAERLALATWVVDDPDELKALSRYGLYGVGSNRPGALLEALESQ